MAIFQSKKYRGAADASSFAVKYRALMAKHPFLLFGLPFVSVIVAGSFVLTPATAIRYERHDRRVRQLTRDEELGVGKGGRKVNIKDEYYVRPLTHTFPRSRALTECASSEASCKRPRRLGTETRQKTCGRKRRHPIGSTIRDSLGKTALTYIREAVSVWSRVEFGFESSCNSSRAHHHRLASVIMEELQ